ncbi:MAG: EAL domain-containing protein [Gallionella sp.]|jgi:EAL domain-containing protein (putative c-di-GMP-specific phosphodiesterase class I)
MNTHNFTAINNRVSAGDTGGVTGLFRDFTVATAFQPIFSLSHRNPVGYEALCRPVNADGMQVSPLALFGQVKDESDNVLLDRLCRAVHVQNFSNFSDKSWIFLNVNPLVTVLGKSYGSFFKEMLEKNAIPPSQVVVEILEKGIYDESILSAAVNYYKNLGCLIAIDDFGASHSNFDRIWNIQPDIVKFDRSIIVQAENSPVVRKALPNLVGLIQELGCIALMEGIETEQQALIAIDSNVDLVQGYYFGYPRAVLVDQTEPNTILSELRDKHTIFSETIRTRYRDAVDQCLIEFKAVLQTIKVGSEQLKQSCEKLLALPGVMRVYFLDAAGYQIGENLLKNALPEYADPRYKPLSEATGANWSRRYYFRQAMLNPGEVQVTRPYRSLTGKSQCITISALVDTPDGKLVACLDLDWS